MSDLVKMREDHKKLKEAFSNNAEEFDGLLDKLLRENGRLLKEVHNQECFIKSKQTTLPRINSAEELVVGEWYWYTQKNNPQNKSIAEVRDKDPFNYKEFAGYKVSNEHVQLFWYLDIYGPIQKPER